MIDPFAHHGHYDPLVNAALAYQERRAQLEAMREAQAEWMEREPAQFLTRRVPLGAPECASCGRAFLPSVLDWHPYSPDRESLTQSMGKCDACRRIAEMRMDLLMGYPACVDEVLA